MDLEWKDDELIPEFGVEGTGVSQKLFVKGS
jgi:hypothetical protein